jgi:hypothetical protein
MGDKNFLMVCDILQDSEVWDKEILDRCSPTFLIVRSIWLESKKKAELYDSANII